MLSSSGSVMFEVSKVYSTDVVAVAAADVIGWKNVGFVRGSGAE